MALCGKRLRRPIVQYALRLSKLLSATVTFAGLGHHLRRESESQNSTGNDRFTCHRHFPWTRAHNPIELRRQDEKAAGRIYSAAKR